MNNEDFNMYIFPKQMKYWYIQIKSINKLVWTKLDDNRKKKVMLIRIRDMNKFLFKKNFPNTMTYLTNLNMLFLIFPLSS